MDNDNEPSPGEPVLPSAPDPEAHIERLRHLAERTQNPMYAWLALEARLQAEFDVLADGSTSPEFSIPGWIAEYLLSVAQDLISLASGRDPREPPETFKDDTDLGDSAERRASLDAQRLSSAKAMSLVSSVFGLQRPGWNAFDSFIATTNKMHEFRAFEAMRAAGVPHKEALHAIGKGIGVADPSARIRDGRDLAEGNEVVEPGG